MVHLKYVVMFKPVPEVTGATEFKVSFPGKVHSKSSSSVYVQVEVRAGLGNLQY